MEKIDYTLMLKWAKENARDKTSFPANEFMTGRREGYRIGLEQGFLDAVRMLALHGKITISEGSLKLSSD